MSFKPKPNKKIKVSRKYTTTLDSKHKEFTNQFRKDELDNIPNLRKEKKHLIKQLEETEMTLEEQMDIQDRIKEIKIHIHQLKNKKLNYFLDNSNDIFDYFEEKQNISKVIESNKNSTKSQLLFNIFKINKQEQPIDETKHQNIVQRYLSRVDESFLDVNAFVRQSDICQHCYRGEMIPLEDEGVLICNECGVNIPFLIENEKPSYKEPPKEVCFYAYKKINHFKEILAQFQAKETTQIPDIVINLMRNQIRKERIGLEQLTYYKTKEILKKLGYNKLYEHIAFIKNKLGIRPPILSPELEATLCSLFVEIQTPYAKHCPDDRVNFLHYYFVLYKFCELLEENQYLHDIPMLKDREKLIEQDEIWKKICAELDWEFIPTV
jgi:hypothetical protein